MPRTGNRGNDQPKPGLSVARLKSGAIHFSSSAFASGLGREGEKVSRKPGLPTVMASPVKGSSLDIVEGHEAEAHSREFQFFLKSNLSPDASRSRSEDSLSGKEAGEKDCTPSTWLKDTFRRASLASQALSHSLNEVQNEVVKGSIGLLPVPPGNAKTAPMGATSAVPASNRASRSSTRISATIANQKIISGLSMHANQSNGTDTPPSKKGRSKETKKVVTLDVLKHCTVFVDVRTDAGDDAGELFIQMLMAFELYKK